MSRLRIATLGALLGPAAAAWACTSDASCQLNGLCVAGKCRCDPQWLGQNCSTLNLGASAAAYSGMQSQTSTWGGHPVWDPKTKLWHGYFAEMSHHCTLSDWTTNSMTVHATSPNASGPFVFRDILQNAWSHNPLVSVDPASGEIFIAHIGCGKMPAGAHARNCSAGAAERTPEEEAAAAGAPPCGCPVPYQGIPCQTLQVLRSSSFGGPWTDATIAWPLRNASLWPSSLSNPSLLLEDNSALM